METKIVRKEEIPSNEVLAFMERLGFVHESIIEQASSTKKITRQRWNLSPIRLGNQFYYSMEALKEHMLQSSDDVSI